MNKLIIPVLHCFNNNYVIPASVSFYSMLKNSNKNYFYKLYVLHNDITQENQIKLRECIKEFSNSDLTFINVNKNFENLFTNTKSKRHYTKEMYYKFLAPSLFEEYDKIIITDVDVVWLNDISKDFIEFDVNNDYYLAGVRVLAKKSSSTNKFLEQYKNNFSLEEIKALNIGAGYMIFNLNKMRENNIEKLFIDFANNNFKRLIQPEQDTINLICYPKIKFLNPAAMVVNHSYELFKIQKDDDIHYSKEEVEYALNNPVQLHYISAIKPWNNPTCYKSEFWYYYLSQTNFFNEFMKSVHIEKSDIKIKKLLGIRYKSKKVNFFIEHS